MFYCFSVWFKVAVLLCVWLSNFICSFIAERTLYCEHQTTFKGTVLNIRTLLSRFHSLVEIHLWHSLNTKKMLFHLFFHSQLSDATVTRLAKKYQFDVPRRGYGTVYRYVFLLINICACAFMCSIYSCSRIIFFNSHSWPPPPSRRRPCPWRPRLRRRWRSRTRTWRRRWRWRSIIQPGI